MRKADQDMLDAASSALSTVMYFVRTVCELMRLNSETELPFMMHVEMFLVLAVFFEGLDMIVTAPDSKDAQRRWVFGGFGL